MPTLAEFQARFCSALLNDTHALPLEGAPVPGAMGLAVHRHNVLGGLTEALGAQYPVIRRLVGEEFFAMTALEFLRDGLPQGPVMIGFGAAFPAFLEGFPPAATLPYLGDVARLEYAMHESYHAADVKALDRQALVGHAAEALAQLTLVFHPSLRLVASEYPIGMIWRLNQPENDLLDTAELPDHGECLLIARPDDVVETTVLTTPAFDFLSALAGGATLSAAQSVSGDDFDGAGVLLNFLDSGLVAGIKR